MKSGHRPSDDAAARDRVMTVLIVDADENNRVILMELRMPLVDGFEVTRVCMAD